MNFIIFSLFWHVVKFLKTVYKFNLNKPLFVFKIFRVKIVGYSKIKDAIKQYSSNFPVQEKVKISKLTVSRVSNKSTIAAFFP